MKYLILLSMLAGCTGQGETYIDGFMPDLSIQDQQDLGSTGQSNQGGLPIGFNERGCQYDNPACGQPTPGTIKLNPHTDPNPAE